MEVEETSSFSVRILGRLFLDSGILNFRALFVILIRKIKDEQVPEMISLVSFSIKAEIIIHEISISPQNPQAFS